MKTSLSLQLGILTMLALLFPSCFGVSSDGLHENWVLYVHSVDTLRVDYPVCNDESGRSSIKTEYQTIPIHTDTICFGKMIIRNGDYSNINVHLYRETFHSDVDIFFVKDYFCTNMINIENHSYNYHAIDSLLELYGVTMPKGQNCLMVSIARDQFSK